MYRTILKVMKGSLQVSFHRGECTCNWEVGGGMAKDAARAWMVMVVYGAQFIHIKVQSLSSLWFDMWKYHFVISECTSGSDTIPAQFVLLSAYIESARAHSYISNQTFIINIHPDPPTCTSPLVACTVVMPASPSTRSYFLLGASLPSGECFGHSNEPPPRPVLIKLMRSTAVL